MLSGLDVVVLGGANWRGGLVGGAPGHFRRVRG